MGNKADIGQLVTFRLGSEIYGIDIFNIQEVIHLQKINAIPKSPDFVEGVIELRDQIIPVVNLKKRLSVREEGGERQRIVILDLHDQVLGIIVDDISKVLKLGPENYSDLPEAVTEDWETSCINRLAKTEDGLIIIISPERILTQKEKKILRDFTANPEQEPMHAGSLQANAE